ncbi:MAG: class I SAM-dependent methyltransferase, partial [Luteolibacter sp.]
MPEQLHDKCASRGAGHSGIRVPAQRVVIPELLDSLSHDDPSAKNSRRDLAWINWMMGNDRWILRQLARATKPIEALCELGAGEGGLVAKIHRRFPAARIAACDLMPKPAALSDRIDWHCGDLMELEPPLGGVLVCNLFLHHFEQEMLKRIGAWFDHFDALL